MWQIPTYFPSEDPLSKSLGQWHDLPIVAIGPRGGKIVGYGAGNKPIYAGSKKANELAKMQRHVALPGSDHNLAAAIAVWLKELGIGKDVHHDGDTVSMPEGVGQQLLDAYGVKPSGKTSAHWQFKAGDLKPFVGKPLVPHGTHRVAWAAKAASGELEADPFPADLSQLKEINAGKAAGSHGNRLFLSPDGRKWLFKPSDPTYGAVIPRAEEAAARVGRLILGPGYVQAVKYVKLAGADGALLEWLPGEEIPQGAYHKTSEEFVAEHFSEFVEHQIVDWLVSNHDAHSGNFITTPDGKIAAIDKGQAWKFIGKDTLSATYQPHGNPSPQVYKFVWAALANGKVKHPEKALEAARKVLAKIDGISLEQFAEIIKPYAITRAKVTGETAEEATAKLVARRESLRGDWTAFLAQQLKMPVAAVAAALAPSAEAATSPDNFETMPEAEPEAPAPTEAPALTPGQEKAKQAVSAWKAHREWEAKAKVGDPVAVRWTSSFQNPVGKGKIVKVNAKSIVVELGEDVPGANKMGWKAGQKISVPRNLPTAGPSKWTWKNSIFPPHVTYGVKITADIFTGPQAPVEPEAVAAPEAPAAPAPSSVGTPVSAEAAKVFKAPKGIIPDPTKLPEKLAIVASQQAEASPPEDWKLPVPPGTAIKTVDPDGKIAISVAMVSGAYLEGAYLTTKYTADGEEWETFVEGALTEGESAPADSWFLDSLPKIPKVAPQPAPLPAPEPEAEPVAAAPAPGPTPTTAGGSALSPGQTVKVSKPNLGDVSLTLNADGTYQLKFTFQGKEIDQQFKTISAAAKFGFIHQKGHTDPKGYKDAVGKPVPGVSWGFFGLKPGTEGAAPTPAPAPQAAPPPAPVVAPKIEAPDTAPSLAEIDAMQVVSIDPKGVSADLLDFFPAGAWLNWDSKFGVHAGALKLENGTWAYYVSGNKSTIYASVPSEAIATKFSGMADLETLTAHIPQGTTLGQLGAPTVTPTAAQQENAATLQKIVFTPKPKPISYGDVKTAPNGTVYQLNPGAGQKTPLIFAKIGDQWHHWMPNKMDWEAPISSAYFHDYVESAESVGVGFMPEPGSGETSAAAGGPNWEWFAAHPGHGMQLPPGTDYTAFFKAAPIGAKVTYKGSSKVSEPAVYMHLGNGKWTELTDPDTGKAPHDSEMLAFRALEPTAIMTVHANAGDPSAQPTLPYEAAAPGPSNWGWFALHPKEKQTLTPQHGQAFVDAAPIGAMITATVLNPAPGGLNPVLHYIKYSADKWAQVEGGDSPVSVGEKVESKEIALFLTDAGNHETTKFEASLPEAGAKIPVSPEDGIPSWLKVDPQALPPAAAEKYIAILPTVTAWAASFPSIGGGWAVGAKPSTWPSWVPPPGVLVEAVIDGKKYWMTSVTMGHEKVEGNPFDAVTLALIDEEGHIYNGGKFAGSMAIKSLISAMSKAGMKVDHKITAIDAHKAFDTKAKHFAAGESYLTVKNAVSPSVYPMAPPAPVKITVPILEKKLVKKTMPLSEALALDVDSVTHGIKIKQNKKTFDLVVEETDGALGKLEALIAKYGLQDVVTKKKGVSLSHAFASIPIWALNKDVTQVTTLFSVSSMTQTVGADNFATMPEGTPQVIKPDVANDVLQELLEKMPEGTTIVRLGGLFTKKGSAWIRLETGVALEDPVWSLGGYPLTVVPPGSVIGGYEPPKYTPVIPWEQSQDQLKKAEEAKKLAKWAKEFPPVGEAPALKALSYFQAAAPEGMQFYAREAGPGEVLVGSEDPGFPAFWAGLGLPTLNAYSAPIPGQFYVVKVEDLQKALPASGTITGPDGGTYPHGTKFEAHEQTTSLGEVVATDPKVYKLVAHKTDPALKAIKLKGTGPEQIEEGKAILAKYKLEQVDEPITGSGNTLFIVKAEQLAAVGKTETVTTPEIPPQPPPFTAKVLPFGSSGTSGGLAPVNRSDLASVGVMKLGRLGHAIRMGKHAIFRDGQVMVRRVKAADGKTYLEIQGQLEDIPANATKGMTSATVAYRNTATTQLNGSPYKDMTYDPDTGTQSETGEPLGTYTGRRGTTANGTVVELADTPGKGAMHGVFKIRLADGADPEKEMAAACEMLGLDPQEAMATPSADDVRLTTKLFMARAMIGPLSWFKLTPEQKRDEKWLDSKAGKMLSRIGEIEWRHVGGGRVAPVLNDQEASKEAGVRFVYMGIKEEGVALPRLLNDDMASNKRKMQNGVSGLQESFHGDEGHGSSGGVFTRIGNANSGGGWGMNCNGVKLVFHPRVLDRLDWYAHSSDEWGDTKSVSGNPRYQAFTHNISASNEVCLQESVSMRDLAGVICSSKSDYEKLSKQWDALGLGESYNGVPKGKFLIYYDGHSRDEVVKKLDGLKEGVLP